MFYNALLHTLQLKDRSISAVLSDINATEMVEEWELIPGLQDLHENDEGYMGGVANGMGLQTEHHRTLDELDTEGQVDALDAVEHTITDMVSDDETDGEDLS